MADTSGSAVMVPHILTDQEAANCLRVDVDNQAMLDMLGGVDAYIKNATGRDWSQDDPVEPVAKNAARIVLVNWYENPGMMGQGVTPMSFGLKSALAQLEAMALDLLDTEETPE